MKYFKDKEFRCQCGCGMTITDEALLSMLEKAREIAGVPFVITSGARCKKHNAEVGGVEGSAHTKGLAVDIKFQDSNKCFKILKALYEVGFNRIGINFCKGFIHCDVDYTKPQQVLFRY